MSISNVFSKMLSIFSDNNIRKTISICSFIAAIAFAGFAMFCPPMGIIDSSVLWFCSQLFVFISGLLGINMSIDFGNKRLSVSESMNNKDSDDKK